MKKAMFVLLAVMVFQSGMACSYGNNNLREEKRKVDNFTAIKVSSGIDLYLSMGTKNEVSVKADEEIIDEIVTKVDDGVLKIYIKDKISLFKIRKEKKVYVTVEKLEMLNASAGSDVISENTIQSDDLKIDVSSGSDVKINVKAKSLNLDASSGSDVTISGETEYLKASASSGSDIDAGGLMSKVCKVHVSSGADALVYASEELQARASSGGDIRYSGNPGTKDIEKSSGGDVSRR